MKITICTDIADGLGSPAQRQIPDHTYTALSKAALAARQKLTELETEPSCIDVVDIIRLEMQHTSDDYYDSTLKITVASSVEDKHSFSIEKLARCGTGSRTFGEDVTEGIVDAALGSIEKMRCSYSQWARMVPRRKTTEE